MGCCLSEVLNTAQILALLLQPAAVLNKYPVLSVDIPLRRKTKLDMQRDEWRAGDGNPFVDGRGKETQEIAASGVLDGASGEGPKLARFRARKTQNRRLVRGVDVGFHSANGASRGGYGSDNDAMPKHKVESH